MPPCEYCGHEHAPNPFYCIAWLQDRIDEKNEEIVDFEMAIRDRNESMFQKDKLIDELMAHLADRDERIMAQSQVIVGCEAKIKELKAELAEWEATAAHEADGLESWKEEAEKAKAALAEREKEIERLIAGILKIRHEFHDGGSAIHLLPILNTTLKDFDDAKAALAGKEREDEHS